METIKVYKRGHDYTNGKDYIVCPYGTRKSDVIEYIKEVFGADAFRKYKFQLVQRVHSRWSGITR